MVRQMKVVGAGHSSNRGKSRREESHWFR